MGEYIKWIWYNQNNALQNQTVYVFKKEDFQ